MPTSTASEKIKEKKSELTGLFKVNGDLNSLPMMRDELIKTELQALTEEGLTADDYIYAESNSVTSSDVDTALLHIRWAWNDHGPCTRFWLCATYIDDFGISFSDGNFGIRVGIYRLHKSAHECIVKAKEERTNGNKAQAVQWVMASQIHNRPVYEWLRNHGDAVITALDQVY